MNQPMSENVTRLIEKVAHHLADQGRRAIDPGRGCLYKTPDGLMCAVGCLFSAEQHLEHAGELEDTNYFALPGDLKQSLYATHAPDLDREAFDNLMGCMQGYHDAESDQSPTCYERMLEQVSDRDERYACIRAELTKRADKALVV